jgi:hypothetical protein
MYNRSMIKTTKEQMYDTIDGVVNVYQNIWMVRVVLMIILVGFVHSTLLVILVSLVFWVVTGILDYYYIRPVVIGRHTKGLVDAVEVS